MVSKDGHHALSREQKRFYYLHKMSPYSSELLVNRKISIEGFFRIELFKQAWASVIAKNPILTSYCDSAGVEPILRYRSPFQVSQDFEVSTDLCEPTKAFDLSKDCLFRGRYVRISDVQHVFFIQAHHIILDAWSMDAVLRELFEIYRTIVSKINPIDRVPTVSLETFVQYETQQNTSQKCQEVMDYWGNCFSPCTHLDWKFEQSSSYIKSQTADFARRQIETPLSSEIISFCRKRRITPYVFWLAALQAVVYRFTQTSRFAVGAPISARDQIDFLNLKGVLVHWTAYASEISENHSFEEILRAAHESFINGYKHRSAFEDLLTAASCSPPFQIVFNQNKIHPLPAVDGHHIQVSGIAPTSSHFDLTLTLEQNGNGFALEMVYLKRVMSPPAAGAFLNDLTSIARLIVSEPSIPILKAPSNSLHLNSIAARAPLPVVIASTFTSEMIEAPLKYWLQLLNFEPQISFAGLNQIFQELVNPMSSMSKNQSGINVLLIRLKDWQNVRNHVDEWIELLESRVRESLIPHIVVITPGIDDANANVELIEKRFSDHPLIHVVCPSQIESLYPVQDVEDLDLDAYAAVPYTEEYFTALGTMVARKIQSIRRPGPKVLALDCDNTLWKGVVGEDGVENISFTKETVALQKKVIDLYETGTLICLTSKNNEADVFEVFSRRPEMLLKREHILSHRINWQPKSENLKDLAKELNLGLDSFLFVDDSPLECDDVSFNCPGTLVLRADLEDEEWISTLQHFWPLDLRKTTATDRARNDLYRQDSHRQKARSSSKNLNDFIATLNVRVQFLEVTHDTIGRASQMTQRTNQFNTTTQRLNETDIRQLIAEPNREVRLVEVADRFGDYGIVGLISYQLQSERTLVDHFLISCRALGRGVEISMLKHVAAFTRSRRGEVLEVKFQRTAKNQPALQFLESVAGSFRVFGKSETDVTYHLPVDVAENASDNLGDQGLETSNEPSVPPPVIATVRPSLWTEIAHDLRMVCQIQARIHQFYLRISRCQSKEIVAPEGEAEVAVALVFAHVLKLPIEQISRFDNFYSLGGDSLRSLQVASQLKKNGYSVSPLQISRTPSIYALAKHLEVDTSLSSSPEALEAAPHSPFHLSHTQKLMIAKSSVSAGAYHIQHLIDFEQQEAKVCPSSLNEAFRVMIAAHPQLRCELIVRDGEVFQKAGARSDFNLKTDDIKSLSTNDQQAYFAQLLADDRSQPYRLSDGGDISARWTVCLTSSSTFSVLFSCHHSFCDGWGIQEFWNDWSDIYMALLNSDEASVGKKLSLLANCKSTYRNWVNRENRADWVQSSSTYWKQQMNLPLAPTSHLVATSTTKEQARLSDHFEVALEIAHPMMTQLESHARRAGVPLKILFLSALYEVAREKLKIDLPVLASVCNGRTEDISGGLKAFGLFWRFVPVKAMNLKPVQNQLTDLHQWLAEAEANVAIPLQDMLGGAAPEDVIPISFNYISFHNANWRNNDRSILVRRVQSYHRFHFLMNLTVRVNPQVGDAKVRLDFDNTRVSEETALAWLNACHFKLVKMVN